MGPRPNGKIEHRVTPGGGPPFLMQNKSHNNTIGVVGLHKAVWSNLLFVKLALGQFWRIWRASDKWG